MSLRSWPEKVMIVGAHPDDEVLLCGGLAHAAASAGAEVTALLLTEGCTTQYPGEGWRIDQKQKHAAAAASRLGAEVRFGGLPDMRLSTLPIAEIAGAVGSCIEEFEPVLVITHSSGDLNSDHRVVHEAVRVSTRPGRSPVVSVLAGEVLSTTEIGLRAFDPRVFVPLQERHIAAKEGALSEYTSEVQASSSPRSLDAVRHLAALRGVQCGAERAEAFELVAWYGAPWVR